MIDIINKKGDIMNKVPRKKLSTTVTLILSLLFAIVLVLFGICIGFLINSILNQSIIDITANIVISLLVCTIYMLLLIILMRNSDIKNVHPLKWYINNILIGLIIAFIIAAITVFTLGTEEGININYLVGFGIFPLIGIITTPNIVKYVIKDTEKWKKIFYKNGNLNKIKNSKDYYRVDTPVSFEKKILSALYKEQLKNILVVIAFMLLVILLSINYMIKEHSYTGEVLRNIIALRARRSFGFIFFLMIFFLAFGIPIIAFYISNALKKIRVVKNHEYIAYHAIIPGVHNGNIAIYKDKAHYNYKYCTCIGIKEKEVNQTPATLIFIPDDVLLFPDNDDIHDN